LANTTVSLLRYCKTASGWRRMRVSTVRKGRGWNEEIKTSQAIIEKGEYQIRWYTGSMPKFKGVGDDLSDAIVARDHQASILALEKVAKAAGRALVPDTDTKSQIVLAKAKDEFIKRKENTIRRGGAPLCKKTIDAYEFIIGEFLTVTKRVYADQILDKDLLDYFRFLRDRGLEERTVSNYYQSLSTFLKYCKVDSRAMLRKEDGSEDLRPSYDDPEPEPYTREEVETFLAACEREQDCLFFSFLLNTGARELEATHCEFSDINWGAGYVHFRNKTIKLSGGERIVFRTKTGKSRKVPVEPGFLEKLKTWRKKSNGRRFLFPQDSGADQPRTHYLDICKRVARKAELNCGTCITCVSDNKCESWFLHKWRATYATWSLQGGIDIKTVSKRLGHTKIEMTAKYLGEDRTEGAILKLSNVFGACGSAPLANGAGA
jgi:integrase